MMAMPYQSLALSLAAVKKLVIDNLVKITAILGYFEGMRNVIFLLRR